MRKLLPIVVSFAALASAVYAAPGPIRVLFLGKEGTASTKHCAAVMQELGRDAIWFDYSADAKQVTPEWLRNFDAVLLDAPKEDFSGLDAAHVVTADFSSDESAWTKTDFIEPLKHKLEAAVGDARASEWQAFLAQREPEKREANPNVANYERRATPITFQEPYDVKGSMERTQVPADMHLEVFASSPDIVKPIAFAWDERGRLWVAESRDYPHGVTASGEGNDDIKICEDTDGDGKADKFTIFADHLNLPTSLVFANGGVIVAQPPRFLFLKSTKGDDHADVREVLMDSWGVRDTHAQASNLHYGFDNWIYGCVGYSGFKGTVGGRNLDFSMGTYRFKADGSEMQFLHQFSNNSWGQSFNAAGDDFGGTANNAPIFYGGIPAQILPDGMRATTAKKINVEDKAHAITPNYRQVDVFGGYTAAAGSRFIYSKNLPPRLQGRAMVCEPTMKIVSLMDVEPSGAGYVAKDDFNLVASTDEWMSPVASEVGPDGSVWFADWENFIIQHNPTPSVERGGYNATTGPGGAHENALRDHFRGRIYRVVWNSAQKPSLISLKDASTAQLVAALGNDTEFWRLTAQRLLLEGKKTDAAPELKQLVTANDGSVAAIHALWTLNGLGLLDAETHRAALLAKDFALRRNAVRALDGNESSEKLLFGSGVVSDPEPHTRLAALVKLADFPTTSELQELVRNLASDPQIKADEWLQEAEKILMKKHHAQTYKEGPNLLPNPGFEVIGADGLPEGWKRRDYGRREGNDTAKWEVVNGTGKVHGGEHAVRCIATADADTSLFADVAVKPNTDYRLSGWVKTHALKGKVSFNDHLSHHETERVSRGDSGWTEIDVVFNSGNATQMSINVLQVAKGDGYFDDVKLCEAVSLNDGADKVTAGDPKRGEQIFFHHPTAACVLCHSLRGQGSTFGPVLDGIASRATPAYIEESLLEPNKVLAKGFEKLGTSPMPPMGIILKPQELEDIKAFLHTLK